MNHPSLPSIAFNCLVAALLCDGARADVLEVGIDGVPTVVAADRRTATRAEVGAGAPAGMQATLELVARTQALHPALLEALVWQESRWHSDALSAKGAIGLAQLMPDTARELGVDPHDPAANLDGGARYLRRQLDRFDDLPSALAAYNAGPARVVASGGVPAIPETRRFVAAVLDRLASKAGHATPTP